ncbi:hypothetical protein CBR_g27907 [Chara braunii]|uniref:Reverse transcriptase domain-containing protein n=1 Tax=Chara braunii TaxID=69332 RepID=A0A388L921_CHABU|nr:hypothetical protein CBR_g27907 [Chara braunii]|eukprot:GBG78683.1 hypothetical protein CBR_g27907 [Chara braunii]
MAELAMEDVFRKSWPEEKGFTWTGAGVGRRSRLDMAWMQQDLLRKLVRITTVPVAMSDHKILLAELLLPAAMASRAQPPTVPHWMFQDPLHVRLVKQHWECWATLRKAEVSATQHFQAGLGELRRLMLMRARATRQAHLRTGEEYARKLEELGTEPGEEEEEEWWVQWSTVKAQREEWERDDAKRWGMLTKVKWVRLKERMTEAFFKQGQSKRVARPIKVLQHPFQEGAPLADTTQQLLQYVQDFYGELYTETEEWEMQALRQQAWDQIWEKCGSTLTAEQSVRLKEEITLQEIKTALSDLPKNKAAGPDGMPMDHLQAASDVIGPLLLEICNSFFKDAQVPPEGFGEANIILLYKKGNPTEIRNWRPVSLLSAPYKLYAKVLANRLTAVLPGLVHPTQTGFVPARQILTNVIMVREVLERATEQEPPLAVMLLDFEKAYDRVRWSFLLQGLEGRGIGVRFRTAVQVLLASATAAVQINCFRTNLLKVTRSVRQGCPLSPTLYILYVKHLHEMLRQDTRIKGLPLPGQGELKSNSFADDTAAFVECSEGCVQAVREQVGTFETYAGAKVNWQKSVVMLPAGRGAECFPDMRIVQGGKNTKYLGILIPAVLSTGEQMENLLMTTITRMNRWAGKTDVGILGRVLVANNAVSSMLWVVDLWDEERGEWKEDAQLEAALRHQADRKQRLDQVRKAIPEAWKQRLSHNRRAGGLWLNLQLVVPTYQWMAAYSASTDTLCKACGQKEETIPHLWLECDPQRTFWEWWGTMGTKVPLHPGSPNHRAEVLVGQILVGGATRPVQAYAGDMIRGAFWVAMWAMRGRLLTEGVKGLVKTLQHWFLRNLKAAVTADMQRKQKGSWPFPREAWGAYTDVLQMNTEPGRWEWSDGFRINREGDLPDQEEGDPAQTPAQTPSDESERPENGTSDRQPEEERPVEAEQMESGTQERQQTAERPERGRTQEDGTQDCQQGNERPEWEMAQELRLQHMAHQGTGQEFVERLKSLDVGPGDMEENEWWAERMETARQWREWQIEDAVCWGHRDKEAWILVGEKMARRFFAELKQKKSSMIMAAMEHPYDPQVGRQETTRGILKCVTDFYKDLFTEEEVWTAEAMEAQPEEELWRYVQSKLDLENSCKLEQDITPEEVEQAITALPRLKTPGLDGILIELFKEFKNFFAILLAEAYNEALQRESLLEGFADSWGGVEQMAMQVVAATAKLSAWGTAVHLGVFDKSIVIKNSIFATLWYAGAIRMPGRRTFAYLRQAIQAYLWSSNADALDSICRVAWRKLVQPRSEGGLGLLEPPLQMMALQMRHLLWFLLRTVGEQWCLLTRQHLAHTLHLPPALVEVGLASSNLIGHVRRGAVWSAPLGMWKKIDMLNVEPATADAVYNQLLFDNRFICDENGDVFAWQGRLGAFGRQWAEQGVFKIGHLWDEAAHDWKTDAEMAAGLPYQVQRSQRLKDIKQAIPTQWVDLLREDKLCSGEWVKNKGEDTPAMIYRVEEDRGEVVLVTPWKEGTGKWYLGARRLTGMFWMEVIRLMALVTFVLVAYLVGKYEKEALSLLRGVGFTLARCLAHVGGDVWRLLGGLDALLTTLVAELGHILIAALSWLCAYEVSSICLHLGHYLACRWRWWLTVDGASGVLVALLVIGARCGRRLGSGGLTRSALKRWNPLARLQRLEQRCLELEARLGSQGPAPRVESSSSSTSQAPQLGATSVWGIGTGRYGYYSSDSEASGAAEEVEGWVLFEMKADVTISAEIMADESLGDVCGLAQARFLPPLRGCVRGGWARGSGIDSGGVGVPTRPVTSPSQDRMRGNAPSGARRDESDMRDYPSECRRDDAPGVPIDGVGMPPFVQAGQARSSNGGVGGSQQGGAAGQHQEGSTPQRMVVPGRLPTEGRQGHEDAIMQDASQVPMVEMGAAGGWLMDEAGPSSRVPAGGWFIEEPATREGMLRSPVPEGETTRENGPPPQEDKADCPLMKTIAGPLRGDMCDGRRLQEEFGEGPSTRKHSRSCKSARKGKTQGKVDLSRKGKQPMAQGSASSEEDEPPRKVREVCKGGVLVIPETDGEQPVIRGGSSPCCPSQGMGPPSNVRLTSRPAVLTRLERVIEARDAELWGLGSKSKWVQDAERMSRAFFTQMKKTSHSPLIVAMGHPFDPLEAKADTTPDIIKYVELFYENLYCEDECWPEEDMTVVPAKDVWDKCATQESPEHKVFLDAPITQEEVAEALSGMHKGAFGKQWLGCGVYRVVDIWDVQGGTWREEGEVLRRLEHQPKKKERLEEIKQVIPQDWIDCLITKDRMQGEWVTLEGQGRPVIFFQLKEKLGSQWYGAEAWEDVGPCKALGDVLVGRPERDGRLHEECIRSVVVLRDQLISKGGGFRAFKPAYTPLQLLWDPSGWEWAPRNSLMKHCRVHQVTTKPAMFHSNFCPINFRW